MARRRRVARDLLASALGGAIGALVTRLLARAGLSGERAAIGVTVAGGVAAVFTTGSVQTAAAGAAAAGAGQLGIIWFAALQKRKAETA